MIALYLHVPFCKKKCSYCSFHSASGGDISGYADALIRCMRYHKGKSVCTVYIGGGTPSLLPPRDIHRIFDALYDCFAISPDAEITMEANPESCDDGFLSAAKECGVNRLSLGVQSMHDGELAAVGRLHTAKQAADAIARARSHGFSNISCDLIFGLPSQTADSFRTSLEKLISLEIPHISCYNLQLERGTPLFKSGITLPDENEQEKMYHLACGTLQNAGYTHYEVSNFARQGFESRHNSVYWTESDYLGLGPAAHSRIGNARYFYVPDTAYFMSRDSFAFDGSEQITDPLFEKLMLGLRTSNGIETAVLSHSGDFCKRLCEADYATVKNGRLRLTDRGFYLSNSIISELAAREC